MTEFSSDLCFRRSTAGTPGGRKETAEFQELSLLKATGSDDGVANRYQKSIKEEETKDVISNSNGFFELLVVQDLFFLNGGNSWEFPTNFK